MNNKQDKGFTLVELLIVIVILGILATVTVFAVRGITTRGQENACAVDKRTAETAIEAYFAENGENPTAIGQLSPEYLKQDPTAGATPNLSITFGADATVIPTVAYAGNCA